jgi:hypothetical protein
MRRIIAFVLGLVLAGGTMAFAQTFTPQSSSGLSVSYTAEKVGGSRVLVFGDVRNATNSTADRVAILAEGLDESGHVVSRGRSFVSGTVPSRGTAPFEVRLLASGTERRYRVQIESFQFLPGSSPGNLQGSSPGNFQGN